MAARGRLRSCPVEPGPGALLLRVGIAQARRRRENECATVPRPTILRLAGAALDRSGGKRARDHSCLGSDLSGLWLRQSGAYAHQRLPVLLRVRELQSVAETQTRRLLRVLLVWFGKMSAGSVLWRVGLSEQSPVEPRVDFRYPALHYAKAFCRQGASLAYAGQCVHRDLTIVYAVRRRRLCVSQDGRRCDLGGPRCGESGSPALHRSGPAESRSLQGALSRTGGGPTRAVAGCPSGHPQQSVGSSRPCSSGVASRPHGGYQPGSTCRPSSLHPLLRIHDLASV
jgi:hypothetical protein